MSRCLTGTCRLAEYAFGPTRWVRQRAGVTSCRGNVSGKAQGLLAALAQTRFQLRKALWQFPSHQWRRLIQRPRLLLFPRFHFFIYFARSRWRDLAYSIAIGAMR
jgi:hypothetical protein